MLRTEAHSRMKKTFPKQPKESRLKKQDSEMFCDSDAESSSPIFHTPPHTPPSEKRMKIVNHQRIETPMLRSLEGGFEFDNESFMRFGSRKRKQTEFLGVGAEEVGEANRRRRQRGRQLLFSPPSIREPRREREIEIVNQKEIVNQPSYNGMHSPPEMPEAVPGEQKADGSELAQNTNQEQQEVSECLRLISLHL